MDACPVNIDLPRMLLALREQLAYGDPAWQVEPADRLEAALFKAWARVVENRRLYEIGLKLLRIGQKLLPSACGMLRRLPPPLHGWTRARDIEPLAGETFLERWRQRKRVS
jgi:L-lactate dehydrogenase complex protein LldF